MTLKKLFSFLLGAGVTGFVYFVLFLIFIFGTFTFAGQTLEKKENIDALAFYGVLVIVVLTGLSVWALWKRKLIITAVGAGAVAMLGIGALIVTGTQYVNNVFYYEAFDQAKWRSGEVTQLNMAKTLVNRNRLLGLTEQEIKELLGDKMVMSEPNGNGRAEYYLRGYGYSSWHLIIEFTNGKVSKNYIYEYGLGL